MIRNISIPLISFMVPSFIVLLLGNIIIEQFFNVLGSSTLITKAFPNGEINVVMFTIFFFASISMIGQIILDISYIFIDPKIKYFENNKISLVKNWVNAYKRRKQLQNQAILAIKPRPLIVDIIKRFCKNYVALISLIIILVLAITCLIIPFVSPFSATQPFSNASPIWISQLPPSYHLIV